MVNNFLYIYRKVSPLWHHALRLVFAHLGTFHKLFTKGNTGWCFPQTQASSASRHASSVPPVVWPSPQTESTGPRRHAYSKPIFPTSWSHPRYPSPKKSCLNCPDSASSACIGLFCRSIVQWATTQLMCAPLNLWVALEPLWVGSCGQSLQAVMFTHSSQGPSWWSIGLGLGREGRLLALWVQSGVIHVNFYPDLQSSGVCSRHIIFINVNFTQINAT